jgi:hypothetical protein
MEEIETMNDLHFDIREKAMERCRRLLTTIGFCPPRFDELVGDGERYYNAEVSINGHRIELYIFAYMAEFTIDGNYNPRFERTYPQRVCQ